VCVWQYFDESGLFLRVDPTYFDPPSTDANGNAVPGFVYLTEDQLDNPESVNCAWKGGHMTPFKMDRSTPEGEGAFVAERAAMVLKYLNRPYTSPSRERVEHLVRIAGHDIKKLPKLGAAHVPECIFAYVLQECKASHIALLL
jgi:hypothetical protein